MKREDRVYPYEGWWGGAAQCRLRIYELPAYTVVMATELLDNPGISVTNFAAELATIICSQYEILPEQVRWVEQYPATGGERNQFPETLALVSFTCHPALPPSSHAWHVVRRQCTPRFYFTNPHWRRMTRGEVEALIGESLGE